MRRKTFDGILISSGVILTVVLVIAGALLMWGYGFAQSNVESQLSAQHITFPAAGSPALTTDPEIQANLSQYAGQELTTGAQAETYADHFIGVHLRSIANGKTYAEMSSQLMADSAALKKDPTNTDLKAKVATEQGQVDTLFKGDTLRGLLLEAYGFSQLGMIALWAGVAAFVFATVMLILVVAGLIHLRRVSPEAQI